MDDSGMMIGKLSDEVKNAIWGDSNVRFWSSKLGDKTERLASLTEEFSDEFESLCRSFENKLMQEIGINLRELHATLTEMLEERNEL